MMRLLETLKFTQDIATANFRTSEEYLQRKAMNQFETTCFIIFSWMLTNNRDSSIDAMSETIIAQDFLERLNFTSDEENSLGPLWGGSYPNEYARLVEKISARYRKKFSLQEAKIRRNVVIQSMRNWFNGNRIIESYIQGVDIGDNNYFSNSIQKIVVANDLDLGLVHKEEIDNLWIQAVLAFLYEGDSNKIKEVALILLPLTMLFQLAEDYANYDRDMRVNKKTIFTSQPKEKSGFLSKIKYMRVKSENYLHDVGLGRLLTSVIRFGWLTKTGIAKLRSFFSKDEWRATKDYALANETENKRFGLLH